ncbi:hypothetical protein [Jeongeupia sp. USM3]|uniref:hypothetical protein n=1 Tax=Jeongeupia sp. USM3 TaxID=1906741 RepID=UPI00089DE47C|nr:hypothetical protein [Jeongeupia sp. USM3]AOY02156.1 hypothetical protein BJP62_01615 [Jeongeupia sp. USM3]
MTDKQIYLRFLRMAEAIRDLPSFPALDVVEERLLNVFAVAWGERRKITVLEAMRLLPDVSESTVHRRLKSLRAKGMLTLIADADDGRTRYVEPTSLADSYFERLAACMEKAQRE